MVIFGGSYIYEIVDRVCEYKEKCKGIKEDMDEKYRDFLL